jgi:methyl-coenzyme M reductase gamma subunit
MMFDMLQRFVIDKKSGQIKYIKDQVGVPLDTEVKVGKAQDAKWLKAKTTMYHSMVGTGFRDDPEAVEYITRIHELRVKYGFMPKEA